MKKSVLALAQTPAGAQSAVLCCGAWGMGTFGGRAQENGHSRMAVELLGVSHGVPSTARSVRFFLIIFRTGNQK